MRKSQLVRKGRKKKKARKVIIILTLEDYISPSDTMNTGNMMTVMSINRHSFEVTQPNDAS